ncbi:Fc receptor-like protein 3 [Eleutherodactylus coqui]|uniref:Fc receptor-like protein 3 n=1 Tax=Eleutherodactylus coqui TaxID=57060 RepID=UPI0034624D7A
MSLTCNVYSTGWTQENIQWYKDNQLLYNNQRTIQITKAKVDDSGDYQCKTASSTRSDPVRLVVSIDWVILQVPSNIYEGDMLTFNCLGWDYWFSQEVKIYKDDHIIRNMTYHVDETGSGKYKCEIRRFIDTHVSKEVVVHVRGLFSVPVVKLTQPLISEGDEMMLTCNTSLLARGRSTRLLFAFYRNEQEVQYFTQNDKYIVSSAQLRDAGRYSCEVTTLAGTVRKRSDGLNIQVQDLFTSPEIKAPDNIKEGDALTLTCDTRRNPLREDTELRFTFYRNGQEVISSNTYRIQYAQLEDSGNYTCEVRTVLGTVMKMSDVTPIRITAAVNKPNLMLLPNEVVLGDDTILRCESSKGSLPIYYLFYHNETLLGNMTIHKKGAAELRLTVRSLTMGGLYYCASYNDFQTQHQQSAADNLLVVAVEAAAKSQRTGRPLGNHTGIEKALSIRKARSKALNNRKSLWKSMDYSVI